MERYEDFAQVTRKALDYALASVGRPLGANQRDILIGEIRLVSSNPFDVIGAQAAGMKAAWVNLHPPVAQDL
jgi:hypothetical protein